MARSIPPFASLRAFEAAARHCSFKKAAEELNLSPSAISHQIKSLEVHLGICLFQRTGNALEMTETARSYWSEVAAALNTLEAASARVEKARDDASLVINLYPSLVSTWLLPALGAFKSNNRDVDIRIVSSLEPIPFTGSDIDVAIRYGDQKPADVMSRFLFAEDIVPVCSPSFLAAHGPFHDPGSILGSTLIYCINNPTEWSQWLGAAGLADIVPTRRMDLDNRALVVEAALGGLGCAMARTPYADRFLQSGDLVIPFDFRFTTGMNYYLCWPERKARFRHVKSFRNWLVSALGQDPHWTDEGGSTAGEKRSA